MLANRATHFVLTWLIALLWVGDALGQRPGRGDGGGGRDEGNRGGQRGERGDRGDRRGGGDFDPTSFLQRLDANGNGVLEQNELSDRTRGFLERMGLDPGRDHSLDSIAERVRAQREAENGGAESRPAEDTTREIVRMVPGFGVETAAVETPARFGADIAIVGGTPSSMSNYSTSIQEMVQQALARYDANNNGVIDGDEFNRVRWSSPSAPEADLNGDGVLTVNEIAERFLVRERAASQADQGRNNRDEGREEEGRRGGEERREGRFSNRDSGNEGGSGSPRGPNEGSSADANRDSGSANAIQGYRKYAEDMLKRYDSDGDGRLSRDEVSKMNRKPVDLDNDGFVSVEEMIEWIGGNTPNTGAGGNTETGGSRTEATSTSERPTRGASTTGRPSRSGITNDANRGTSQTQFSFFERDGNGDGQVQMHEFAQEWSDDVLRQFRSYDLNGDGVITYDEYETARKSR